MSLVEHAKKELELAGMFDKDSDYGGAIGESVLELVEIFAKQGHSGFSAMLTLELFNKVAHYKTIVEFIPSLKDSIEVSETVIQSTRRSDVFTRDGGKNWYSIDTDEKWNLE